MNMGFVYRCVKGTIHCLKNTKSEVRDTLELSNKNRIR